MDSKPDAGGHEPVDIWIIPLDLRLPAELPLSPQEIERAARFRPPQRHAFLARRYSVRRILSGYINAQPEQLEFHTNAYGKPALRNDPDISFNVSHSEDLALCAVVRGRSVGVDLEFIKSVPEMEHIVASRFATAEQQAFTQLPVSQREAAFFRLWTRKEAYIKAAGAGLSYPLDSFCVPLVPSEIDQPLLIRESHTGSILDWSLFSFSPEPGYLGAVVVSGRINGSVQLRQFVR